MDFNFITDEQFRASLVSDFRELAHAHDAQLWKTVHVLAGSIIEALLIEYLIVFKPSSSTKDPLRMDLTEAIAACQLAGVIQSSTASLCDVVRDYRNLIHPGRVIRLQREVTQEGAEIARSLVGLITKEIARKRKDTYGSTAEQILKKLKTDEHVSAVLPQLLSEANQHERRRLADQVIPEAYFQEQSFQPEEVVLERLRSGFRQVFESLDETDKISISAKFSHLVRTDSAEKIQGYGDAFFSADDLNYLPRPDRDLVLKHLLSRLDTSVYLDEGMSRNLVSIGKFIDRADLTKFADTLIKLVLRQSASSLDHCVIFVSLVYDLMESEEQQVLEGRLTVWVDGSARRNMEARSQRLARITSVWNAIPF